MRKKSKKLAAMEARRWSCFTEDLDNCYFCSKKRDDLHELLGGRNRLNSIRYGFVLPVCRKHHNELENDAKLKLKWKQECQDHFIMIYGLQEWFDVFKRNYKD